MLGNQVAAFRNDLICILHDLQFFEAVVLVQPHALANNFEKVDDAERPIALMRAKRAMIGMIHGRQRVDAGSTCSLKLLELELTPIHWKHGEIHALEADGRLIEIEQRHPWDRLQDVGGCFHDSSDARVLVEGNAQLDPL